MRYIKSSLLLVSSIFLFGCSQKIEGEAFLKNGDAVTPLADIEVRVVELEKFHEHIKSKKEGIESEISRINSSINSLEQSNKTLIDAKSAIFNAQMKLLSLGASWNTNSLGGQYMQNKQDNLMNDATNATKSNDDAVAKNNERISIHRKEIEALQSGKNGKFFFYPSDKQEGVVATKTQSNGKFEITLKSSKDAVLLAKNNDKYWLIKVGKDDKKINLTDSNENGLNCDVCVLK